jgi:poly-gamma-glutamate synthesis protein (capsule biosynthesis protein)
VPCLPIFRTWFLASALLAITAAPADAAFESAVKPLDAGDRERMSGVAHHRGCPVALSDLRLVRATHWTFGGRERQGRLVVHCREAHEIRDVLKRLHESRFPIARMHPIERYGGSDRRSMRRNNTSGYNCRRVAGSASWSEHAHGRAVDVNPVQNPYVTWDGVSPRKGRSYLDRSDKRRGMVNESVVRAFRRLAGWRWGGDWSGAKDYQHFSLTGR